MQPQPSLKKPSSVVGGAILALGLLCPYGQVLHAQPAPDNNSVLLLGSSVKDGVSSLEAVQAAALGFTVDVVSDAQWAAKSTADFASYRAIILGDRSCEGVKLLAAAEANKDVWGPAVTGSVIVVGTHPAMGGHPVAGATTLGSQAISFATGTPRTGAYVTLGCFYDASAPGTKVAVLTPFGTFQAVGQNGCSADAHVIAADPALTGLTDATLTGWRPSPARCDTDTGFAAWPSSFNALVIARDVTSSFVAPDRSSGAPFLLARGDNLIGILCGNGVLDPTEQCDDGNNVSGDGCSASCRLETPTSTLSAPAPSAMSLSVPELLPSPKPQTVSATANTTLNFDGTASVQGVPVDVICDACAPDALFGGDNVGLGARVNLDVSATWDPTANVGLQYSPSLLRQGETLDLVDTLSGGSGPLTITYSISGDYGIYFNTTFPSDASIHGTDVNSFSFSLTGSGACTLKLDGDGTYNCSATKVIPIFSGDLFGLAGIDISLPVTTTLSITPNGVVTVRSVSYAGTVATGPNTLTFHGPSPSVLADNFSVACTAPQGAEALYTLTSTQSDPSVSASTSVGVKIEVTIIITVGGTINLGTFGPGPTVTLPLTAPNAQVDLGPIQLDNRPPVVSANGPYSGVEGTAIGFSAAGTTDNCAATLNYVWQFSDGGIAFGISPFHTFNDGATYSGQLVVTDLAGNSASQAFSALVANAPPIANAGPATSSAWGILVAFNGSAIAPGSADQPTLSYAWAFGDGSPSASGGPSVMHAYAMPGTYVATLTVCDEDGLCGSSTRSVSVRKRSLTVAYLGSQTGVFDTSGSLSASLVDEFGMAVAGRAVQFAIGTEAGGSASTNANGLAAVTHVVELDAGTYTATASFAGDALYTPGSGSSAFTVASKGTTLTYTGSLSGGPNKTVTLSAKLLDASGTPLAGRAVTFQVGAQSAAATTDPSGVATTSLKLNQKNGSYPLAAGFSPAGADTNRYLPSGASATFVIGGKSSIQLAGAPSGPASGRARRHRGSGNDKPSAPAGVGAPQ